MKRQSFWIMALFVGMWLLTDMVLEVLTDEIAEVIGQSQVPRAYTRRELDKK